MCVCVCVCVCVSCEAGVGRARVVDMYELCHQSLSSVREHTHTAALYSVDGRMGGREETIAHTLPDPVVHVRHLPMVDVLELVGH